MNLLILASEAHGAVGGIAKFNRDFLEAVATHPAVDWVVTASRRMPDEDSGVVGKVRYLNVRKGKAAYVLAVIRHALCARTVGAIVCGHINLLPVAFMARIFLRAPLILILHGIDAWQPRGKIVNRLLRTADLFVSVSRFTHERFLSWAPVRFRQCVILPNAVDMRKFTPGPRPNYLVRRHRLGGKKVLMTLARLASSERYKGIDEVMEILPELFGIYPDVVYLIVGDGDDRSRLEDKARALGIADRLVFAGFIPEHEKVDYYRAADVFVMPGYGEGFGIVFLEAMACGIPVVASKLDGSREAVRDGLLGVLVDPRDRRDLVRGIDEALRRPREVVPSGLEHFSLSAYQARVHSLIDGLAAGYRPGQA